MGTPSKGKRVNASVLYPSTVITQEDFRRLTITPPPPPPDPGRDTQQQSVPMPPPANS